MLRFKQFLLESPAPPNKKELQDYVFQKEAGGNEDRVLSLHGGPTDPTIAYGHSLQNPEKSKEKFKRLFPEVNADDLISGKANLSKEQAQALFDDDTEDNINKLRKFVPDLDDYTPEAQKGMYSSLYRGVLSGSPAAIKLLKAGEYDKAADELLNHDEYKRSKAGKPIKGRLLPGIAPRMEEESNLIRGEAERRKQSSKPAAAPTVTSTPVSPTPKQETPTAVTPPSDTEYTIQSGETLWKLTKGDTAKIKQIQTANPGLDPNKLSVGQKIKIPR